MIIRIAIPDVFTWNLGDFKKFKEEAQPFVSNFDKIYSHFGGWGGRVLELWNFGELLEPRRELDSMSYCPMIF